MKAELSHDGRKEGCKSLSDFERDPETRPFTVFVRLPTRRDLFERRELRVQRADQRY